MRIALTSLTFIVVGLSSPSAIAERVALDLDESPQLDRESCSRETCATFAEGAGAAAACSCSPFLKDRESEDFFAERAKLILYRTAQALRYLSDRKARESALQRLWLPGQRRHAEILSSSLQDFEFVQSAMDRLEEVDRFATAPVRDLPRGEVPAGVFPIMVEVWQTGLVRSKFLGEAGIPLVKGKATYIQELRPNPSHSSQLTTKQQNLGSISVATEVSFSEPRACEGGPQYLEGETCVEVKLAISCTSADGLPTDAGVPNAKCKVRVKKSDVVGSTKDSSPAVRSASPSWAHGNTFNYTWTAATVAGAEPWTLDHMNLVGHFDANTAYMAKMTVLKGRNCEEIAAPSAKEARVCAALANMNENKVNEGDLDRVMQRLSKEDREALLQIENGLEEKGALLQVSHQRTVLERRQAAKTTARRGATSSQKRQGAGAAFGAFVSNLLVVNSN